MAAFHYNYAIVCRIPQSLGEKMGSIDIDRARQEHRAFIDTLKRCEVNMIELQEDEGYPECVFVEDCAVVIGGTALITRPGHAARAGEVGMIRQVLKNELKLKIIEIEDNSATLDGGDVFFTGKEIFVGISKRTNHKGAQAVVDAFPEYMVAPINVEGVLHLKSCVSMAGRDVLAVGSSPEAQKIFKQIRISAQYSYKILNVDSDCAANMLYINGRLIHRTREEIGEKSYNVLDEKITYPKHKCQFYELEKAQGSLSSMVLLIAKHKTPKKITSNLTDGDVTAYAELKNL